MQQVKCAECGAVHDNDGFLEVHGWRYSFLAPELTRCNDCLRKAEQKFKKSIRSKMEYKMFGPYTIVPVAVPPEKFALEYDEENVKPQDAAYGLEAHLTLLVERGWSLQQVVTAGVIALAGNVVQGPGGRTPTVPAVCALMYR